MGQVLARVARCVKNWVEPLLYNTLELQPNSIPRLLAALQSKAPTFLQMNVHHLRLYDSIPASVLQLVTSAAAAARTSACSGFQATRQSSRRIVCDENTPPVTIRRFLCIADVRLVLVQLDVKGAINDWRGRALSGQRDLWEWAEGTVETLRTAGAVPPASRFWLEDAGEEHGGPYRSLTLAEIPRSLASSDCTLPDTSAERTSWMADVLAALDPNSKLKASPKTTDVLDLTLSPSLPEGWKPVLPVSVRTGKEKGSKAPQLPQLALDFTLGNGKHIDGERLFAGIEA